MKYVLSQSGRQILAIFLDTAFLLLGTLVVILMGMPYLTFLLLPLGVIAYFTQNVYQRTAEVYFFFVALRVGLNSIHTVTGNTN